MGGIVFMDLSINHLTDERFIFLSYLILQNKLDRPKLFISHIFPDAANFLYNIVSIGNIIHRVNDRRVRTVADLVRSMVKPIKSQDQYYLKLETQDGNVIYLTIDEIVAHDRLLAKKYNFNLSATWRKMAKYASK